MKSHIEKRTPPPGRGEPLAEGGRKMKALLVGLGNISLGLITPVFQPAGYELVGTDVSQKRLDDLQTGYVLKTPTETKRFQLDTMAMDEVTNNFDLVITSVGRRNLPRVADWYLGKGLTAPVIMAENLPDPVSLFPRQIPIVVDRVCSRVELFGGALVVTAEDYYKIVVRYDPLVKDLKSDRAVKFEVTDGLVELARERKMFTVNTAHVLAALYGEREKCRLIEEAVALPEVVSIIRKALLEIGPILELFPEDMEDAAMDIIERFKSPIQDPILRILASRASALRYIELPLARVREAGLPAPTLEEARGLLSAN